MATDTGWNTIVSPFALSFVLELPAALAGSTVSTPEDFAQGTSWRRRRS